MLVLSRRNQESIVIGDNIRVRVLNLGDGKVRLGIEAPRDVIVLRSELCGKEHSINTEVKK